MCWINASDGVEYFIEFTGNDVVYLLHLPYEIVLY